MPVGLNINGLNELFSKNCFNGMIESGILFDRLRPMPIKRFLKALVISVEFVISLSFILTMFGSTLILDFHVRSYLILFHIKVVLLRFLSKSLLKYSFLNLRV